MNATRLAHRCYYYHHHFFIPLCCFQDPLLSSTENGSVKGKYLHLLQGEFLFLPYNTLNNCSTMLLFCSI